MIEVTLIDVQEGGRILTLLDGRRLLVRPRNVMTSCVWIPPVLLEIVDDGSRPRYPLHVRNTKTDTRVEAMEVGSS